MKNVLVVLLLTVSVMGQSANTTCNTSGPTTNCTSTTNPRYDDDMQSARDGGAGAGSLLAALALHHKAKKQATEKAEVNYIFCLDNPKSTADNLSCPVYVAKINAFCEVKTKDNLCKWVARGGAPK